MNPEDLDSLLHRARIAEPPDDLRSRLLAAAGEPYGTRASWQRWLPELAAAALIALSLGLLSRPEVLQPLPAAEIVSPIRATESGHRILDTWRNGFGDEPGLTAYLETYLSFLDRASVRDDTPSLAFGTGPTSRRPSS